jgi:hypothetical protein
MKSITVRYDGRSPSASDSRVLEALVGSARMSGLRKNRNRSRSDGSRTFDMSDDGIGPHRAPAFVWEMVARYDGLKIYLKRTVVRTPHFSVSPKDPRNRLGAHKKKGRLRCHTSGPSLGRKRPRRAAIVGRGMGVSLPHNQ